MATKMLSITVGSDTSIPIKGGGSATAKAGESLILMPGSGENFRTTFEMKRPGPNGDVKWNGEPIPAGQEWFPYATLLDGSNLAAIGVDATPTPGEKGNTVWVVNPATNKDDPSAIQLEEEVTFLPAQRLWKVKFLKAGKWTLWHRLWSLDGLTPAGFSRSLTVV